MRHKNFLFAFHKFYLKHSKALTQLRYATNSEFFLRQLEKKFPDVTKGVTWIPFAFPSLTQSSVKISTNPDINDQGLAKSSLWTFIRNTTTFSQQFQFIKLIALTCTLEREISELELRSNNTRGIKVDQRSFIISEKSIALYNGTINY